MSDDLIRYNQTGYDRGMEPASEGAWVRYAEAASTITALRAELEAARADVRALTPHKYSPSWMHQGDCSICGHGYEAHNTALTAPADPQPVDADYNQGVRDAAELVRSSAYFTSGDSVGLEPSKFPGQDQHHNTIAAAILALLRPETQPVDAVSAAARDVLAERQRQVSEEGWTPGHDDQHSEGELAVAIWSRPGR